MGQCISGGNKARGGKVSDGNAQSLSRPSSRHDPDTVPDIRPPRRQRSDVIRDASIFQRVDQHALNAPREAGSSVAALASYLVQGATSDLEKARAFYRWIANNISYAADQYFSGNYASCDAESVLRSRSSVCQGYAELFLALCNQAQIPCRVVSGFAKGYSYNPDSPFTAQTKTNHAWNVVCIKGEWRLVECTWGSGHLNGRTFTKKYSETYFLTDPEDFIIQHFPYMDDDLQGSARFQLLKTPWDLDTFNRRVKIYGSGLDYGLKTLSHDGWKIPVSGEAVVKVRTDRVKMDALMAELLQNNSAEVQGAVLVRRNKDASFSVTVRPPSPGTYELNIFGENKKEGNFTPMVSYVIDCTEAMADYHPYPKDRPKQYGPEACAEEYGLGTDARAMDVLVSKDGKLDFKLGLTRAMPTTFRLAFAEGDLPDLDRHVMSSQTDKSLRVHVRLPRVGFYKLTVFGKHPTRETSSFDVVLTLLLQNLKDNADCQPFPEVYTAANELRCTLVEPLSLYLPANQEVKVQLTSPLLKQMLPDTLKREGDTWRGLVRTEGPGSQLKLYGSKESQGSLNGLYKFLIK